VVRLFQNLCVLNLVLIGQYKSCICNIGRYCTGGIRCEKASAFVRQMVPSNRGVYHLKGGIHKYLEEFGSKDGECAFVGKNFVFDRRGAMSGADCLDGVKSDNGEKVVGQCMYCGKPHDTFLPENVCTVCREPVLVCPNCVDDLRNKQSILRGLEDKQNMRVEFHCEDHFQAKTCYYTSLIGFTALELNDQIQQLQLYTKQFEGIGKKGKQKRRTIRKQIEKIEAFIKAKEGGVRSMEFETELQCRNCGSSTCSGGCWGFHGGNTRMINREKAESIAASQKSSICASINYQKVRTRVPSNQRPMKRLKREKELAEVERLQLCKPASDYKLPNGLRVPPPSIRVLRSSVKGKWCGKSLQEVMSTEFHEFDNRDWLDQVISAGLLRINGISVAKIAEDFNQNASGIVLKNMDTIERVVHWHEPPICVHDSISFTKHTMPKEVLATTDSDTSSLPCLYCVNKPSTVPVHPAGPYYANSLLLQLEAQEGLMPKSLIPCHRIDRCTSGVLLCTDDTNVARVIQGAMTSSEPGAIKKLYVARVKGKFPSSSSEGLVNSIVDASLTWHENVLEVDAPIAVQLSGNAGSNVSDETFGMMHRIVSSEGKHAISRFKLLSYDAKTDQSLVSCAPITGRGHQLRVHLQLIGHPIHNDVEYGGFLDFKYVDIQEKQSIESILNASKESTCLMDESVTEDEAKCAIAMCKCCSAGAEGVKVSFHSAQLLGGGHAIDLHACKYYVGLRQKGINEEEARMHDMVFTVSLPMWALEFQDFAQDEIDWLK
jgi:tRNA pseudouridine synthase 9